MEFFTLPFELRRKIYAEVWSSDKLKFHLYLQDGRLRGSVCLGAELGDEQPFDSQMLRGDDLQISSYADGKTLDRLKSSWGPHYKCEEHTMGTARYHDHPATPRPGCVNMLLVCKEM